MKNEKIQEKELNIEDDILDTDATLIEDNNISKSEDEMPDITTIDTLGLDNQLMNLD